MKKKIMICILENRGFFFQITKNNVKKNKNLGKTPFEFWKFVRSEWKKNLTKRKCCDFTKKIAKWKGYKILRLSLWAMVCRVLGCHILANSSLLGEDLGTGTLLLSVDDDEGDFSSRLFSTVGFSVSPTGFSSLGTRSTDSCNIFRWIGSSQPSPSLKRNVKIRPKSPKLPEKVKYCPKCHN